MAREWKLKKSQLRTGSGGTARAEHLRHEEYGITLPQRWRTAQFGHWEDAVTLSGVFSPNRIFFRFGNFLLRHDPNS